MHISLRNIFLEHEKILITNILGIKNIAINN